MRIACLQFSPQVGEVSKNISKADAVLAASAAELEEGIDLLVLPEMAFSGYNFRTRAHITPYLESPSTGPSSSWAKQKAQSLNCTVAVGYPELHSHTDHEYYNSLLVVNNQGEQMANYQKSFLYYTDETWAKEGPGFYADSDNNTHIMPGRTTAMGICMDINPYKFTNPWNLYEFARHCVTVKANLVVISMAWLTLEMRERFLTGREEHPDLETLAYWVGRLEPLVRGEGGHDEREEIIVVFANRCGWEEEAVYAGSSAVMGVKGGEVRVYGVLGRGVEECLVVDTEGEPFGRLVTRSKHEKEEEEEEEEEAEEDQQRHGNENEQRNGATQPRHGSNDNNNPSSRPPPSSSTSYSTQHQHYHDSNRSPQRPKLTLLTDPLTIPPFRSHPPAAAPPIHLPANLNLSISMTPQTFYNSLPTTPPQSQSGIMWSLSPDNNPFSDKHATTEITSFPVSFSSSFSPSFCSESLSPRSLSSLDDDDNTSEMDANEFFEAWLVSPVDERDEGGRRGGKKEEMKLGYWEEERLWGWRWPPGTGATVCTTREVKAANEGGYDGQEDEEDDDDDDDDGVSPMTTKKEDVGEEEMIRIMASPSVFKDLRMPRGGGFWVGDGRGRGRGVEVR